MTLERKLFDACLYGRIKVIQRLLQNPQINFNCENEHRRTPLYIACQNGHNEIVKLLLKDERVDVNQANHQTPFWIACYFGHVEVVKLLLNDERVDINKARDGGATALMVAAAWGKIEVVKYILASGRDVDLTIRNEYGTTIENATNLGQMEVVELLKLFEKNPNQIRFELRNQLGISDMNATSFYVMMVLLSDDYLKFKEIILGT